MSNTEAPWTKGSLRDGSDEAGGNPDNGPRSLKGLTVNSAPRPDTRRDIASALDGANEVFRTSGDGCYAAGTRIATPAGEKLVEELAEGDLVAVVTTRGRSHRPVRWIGRRRLHLAGHPNPDLAAPIRVRRDAMARGHPSRDLLISPDQCLYIEGVLVPAWKLINDMTVVRESDRQTVCYYQIELEKHAILLAGGLPVDSYLGTSDRSLSANIGSGMSLHPEYQVDPSLRRWEQGACAPLAVDPFVLRGIWQRCSDRAEQLGYTPRWIDIEMNPDLHVVIGGHAVEPIECSTDRYVFIVPRGTGRIVLASRTARQTDVFRYVNDRRMLGVAVASITFRGRGDLIVFPADHLPAGAGWHAPERGPKLLWRWTGGAGELCFEPLADAKIMDVRLSGSVSYIVKEIPAREPA